MRTDRLSVAGPASSTPDRLRSGVNCGKWLPTPLTEICRYPAPSATNRARTRSARSTDSLTCPASGPTSAVVPTRQACRAGLAAEPAGEPAQGPAGGGRVGEGRAVGEEPGGRPAVQYECVPGDRGDRLLGRHRDQPDGFTGVDRSGPARALG